MRNFILLAAFAGCLATLAACSRTPRLHGLRRQVDDTWGHCVYVGVADLKVDRYDNKKVRYGFVLKVQVPGTHPGEVECPDDRRTLLEALAGKDIADLKPGELIPVTEETSY